MTFSYRDLSIRAKLSVLVLFSTLTALLIAATTIVTYDAIANRRSLEKEMSTTADMAARSTTAALAFRDDQAASQALETLAAVPSIRSAYIEDTTGRIVAEFRASPEEAALSSPGDTSNGHRYEDGHLVTWRSIEDSSGRLGMIVIRTTLAPLNSRLATFVQFSILIAALSCFAATLLSSRLQALVLRPIRSLAEVAGSIEAGGDYTHRAIKESNDETGVLVEAFNGMLDKIEERDRSLARYQDELEDLVDERTRQLERSQESLRRSERLATVGTLAAGVAHQINNPVGAILNSSQYALLCEGDDDYIDVWRQALAQNADLAVRCGRIVRSVLQFSRSDATDKWPEDLQELTGRAVQLCRNYAQQKGVTLQHRTVDDRIMVLMSPIEMEQVIVNLIRNGIEATAEKHGTVVVSVEVNEGTVHVEVSDDGSGIAQTDLAHIFDPFFTTRLTQGGTGLGLSMSHGIVVDHAGSIDVESQEGVGSKFVVRLPLCPPEKDPSSIENGPRS